ncbi:MAG: hypothetical protein U0936_20245 [Planctomycetaceae bacterium]
METCRRRQIPLVFWPSPVPDDSVSPNYLADSKTIADEIAKDEFIHLDVLLPGSVTRVVWQRDSPDPRWPIEPREVCRLVRRNGCRASVKVITNRRATVILSVC